MDRPARVKSVNVRVRTGCGKLYVTYGREGEFQEVFLWLGKGGGCVAAMLEAIARLSSLALQAGVPVETVIRALRGARCPSPHWDSGRQVLSCPDAVAQVLESEVLEDAPQPT